MVTVSVHRLTSEEVKVEIRDRKIFLIIRGGGSFRDYINSCPLPECVNVGQIKVEIDNGLVTVTLPKAEKRSQKKNPIVVSNSSGCFGRFFC
ncbi:hypothetical protein REPUB_Repub05bG0169500 [Reevesia pubescens]